MTTRLDQESQGLRIYAPVLSLFPPLLAPALAALPLGSANDLVHRSFSELEPGAGRGAWCGLFVLDPFTRWSELLSELRRFGFRGIANYPPLPVFGGEDGEALAVSGYSTSAEIAKLAAMSLDGFEPLFIGHDEAALTEARAVLGSSCHVLRVDGLTYPAFNQTFPSSTRTG